MVKVLTKATPGTAKQDSASSTGTPPAPITETKLSGDGKQPSSNRAPRSSVFDEVIRREALGLLRKHKRMAVDEIYNILNIRYMDITREDVNAVLIVMGFEGQIVIDYEPVAIIKG